MSTREALRRARAILETADASTDLKYWQAVDAGLGGTFIYPKVFRKTLVRLIADELKRSAANG